MQGRLVGLALGGVFVALLAGACSSKRPPILDDPNAPPDGDAASVFREFDARPQCELGPDGGPCGCLELSLLTDAPNLYFLLDRSGSMNDGGKWSTVRTVIAETVTRLGPRGNFAAAVFPDPSGTECAKGIEVMAPRRGDSPAGRAGPTVLELLAATNLTASGGTPTADTFRSLTPRIASLAGRTFAILATDGGPNCNAAAACDASACIPNIESAAQCPPAGPTCCTSLAYGPTACLDATPTIEAVTALRAAGVPTYVIGVPGSGPYAALLDAVAVAGGTARTTSPKYYNVDTTDASAFARALQQIAAKITATCVLPLAVAPPDPARVNVYLDDVVVPNDSSNGWTLNGSTVTLVGTTCDRVLAGDALDLRVIAGCPTVPPR